MKKSELKQIIREEIHQLNEFNKKEYRNRIYALGDFLKKEFPNVKFKWDEASKGWWTTDNKFVDTYSTDRTNFNSRKAKALKSKVQDLVIVSDFDQVQITLD